MLFLMAFHKAMRPPTHMRRQPLHAGLCTYESAGAEAGPRDTDRPRSSPACVSV
jgi:hypothetical protein